MILHASPLAEAIGWTLLHSLWEGAIIAAALTVAMTLMRSPRARYGAACVALLAMLAGFGFTLLRLVPDANRNFGTPHSQQFPVWNFASGADACRRMESPPLPPSCRGSRRRGSWESSPSTCGTPQVGFPSAAFAAAACVARPSTGNSGSRLSPPVCVCRGPLGCSNPAWSIRRWCWATFVRSFSCQSDC